MFVYNIIQLKPLSRTYLYIIPIELVVDSRDQAGMSKDSIKLAWPIVV